MQEQYPEQYQEYLRKRKEMKDDHKTYENPIDAARKKLEGTNFLESEPELGIEASTSSFTDVSSENTDVFSYRTIFAIFLRNFGFYISGNNE